jgi:hypothetical protein
MFSVVCYHVRVVCVLSNCDDCIWCVASVYFLFLCHKFFFVVFGRGSIVFLIFFSALRNTVMYVFHLLLFLYLYSFMFAVLSMCLIVSMHFWCCVFVFVGVILLMFNHAYT